MNGLVREGCDLRLKLAPNRKLLWPRGYPVLNELALAPPEPHTPEDPSRRAASADSPLHFPLSASATRAICRTSYRGRRSCPWASSPTARRSGSRDGLWLLTRRWWWELGMDDQRGAGAEGRGGGVGDPVRCDGGIAALARREAVGWGPRRRQDRLRHMACPYVNHADFGFRCLPIAASTRMNRLRFGRNSGAAGDGG